MESSIENIITNSPCTAPVLPFDAVPGTLTVLERMRENLCPQSNCNEVDLAILSASVGG